MADTRSSARRRGNGSTHAKRGQILEYETRAGTTTFSMRVRWRGQRIVVRLGNELEGWNRALADVKLQQTVNEITAGTWRPPVSELDDEDRDPIFHEFATVWFESHTADLDDSTAASYSHVLTRYILPEFKNYNLTAITYEGVRRWRDRLRTESEQLGLAHQHNVKVLDRNGKPKRKFGPQTINEALRLLGQILERAVESEHYLLERNPVKGRSGLRLKTPGKPPRDHLEADEVLSLIRAADLVDQGVTPTSLRHAKLARDLRAEGKSWKAIAAEMGCAESTAIYRSRIRPDPKAPRRRRATIVVLSLTGTRAGEHVELNWVEVDHTHGRIVVDDAKTPAGVREIHASPFVREELALYRASLPCEPEPTDPVFAVRGGGRSDRHNLGRRLKHIVAVANEMRKNDGLAPMPKRITPHTFRRTFITLSFQAGKDLVFVQSQAGHADWKTTLEIYTQQSNRSIDPAIRQLLDLFLGTPTEELDAQAEAQRSLMHARETVHAGA